MENLVNVYLFGKRYQVPESLTITVSYTHLTRAISWCAAAAAATGSAAPVRRFIVSKDSRN
mgnify:CR=1 FL=1